jgi:Tfp pilus assembly protein PilF
MSRTLAETYFLKAQDKYPLNLAETFEALNYALSYDDEHIQSNLMLAEIYVEYMNQPDAAESHFHAALMAGTNNFSVYLRYAYFLLDQNRLEEAEKAIDYAENLKGVDLAVLIRMRANIAEKRFAYKKALKLLQSARCHAYNDHFMALLRSDIRRIKQKMSFQESQNKRPKKRNKKA